MSKQLCRVTAIITLIVCSITAIAQNSRPTDGSTPLALSPGAPAGSYSVTGFENINPFSGGLSFRLPLMSVGGRGQAEYTITRKVERRWMVDRFYDDFGQYFLYFPEASHWDGIVPGYGAGVLQGRWGGSFNTTNCNRGNGIIDKLYARTLTRLTFTAPDGTEYELRDKLTDGNPATVPACATSGFSRGKVFVSADGSAATFISDTTISDQHLVNDYGPFTVSGYLMLANGTRYRILNGYIQWIRDRNGNKVNFTYTCSSCGTITQITDSLNRQITPGTGITFKGAGGASRSIQIATASLSTVLRSGYTTQTPAALFPELNGSSATQYNPSVISTITLPNTKQYKLFYNSYAELARVELPTGGAIEYDYAAGLTNSNASGAVNLGSAFGGGFNWQIYRRVIERRVYPNGGTGNSYETKMTISRPETIDGSLNIQSVGYVTVDHLNSAGTLMSRERHYYHGNAGSSLKTHSGVSYAGWKEGKEYKTEIFDTNGTTVLRRIENTWQQPVAGGSWPLTSAETNDSVRENNPQITETITTLEPAGANRVAKQTFTYDKYLNRTNQYEHDYGSGTPGALIRRLATTYVTSETIGGTTYDYACDPATNCNSSAILANVIHVRNLPKQTSVYDAAGVERARSVNEFDNYAADTNHAALTNRSGISGFDSAFTTTFVPRGNITAASRYLLNTAGQVTGSIASYLQYDIAGNVVKTIDPRGCASNFDFSDRFGSPDANARLNSAPLELSSVGQASYAFPTQVTNCLNHVTYNQFDYYLNRPVDAEDANGVVSSSYSDNEPLDRQTKVILAANKDASVKTQTVFTYDDTTRTVTTASDQNTFADGMLVKSTIYVGMARTKETRQYEGGSNYIATQTEYDGLGRAYRNSNPFRPLLGESPVWTTMGFDGSSRVTSVTTPDNATISTSYSGSSVTITDQAGKKRKTVSDALGRAIEVYEDPNGLNYQTTYLYDTLDNLVRVTQGSQQRFFMYDSLRRLIRARNLEQGTLASLNITEPLTGNSAWSTGYQYDANGNLTQKTDARGVVSTYVYDLLNRNTTTDYSDTASINPDVKRFYDGATNGVGRSWYFYNGGDFSTGPNVEHTSVDSYDALGRPKVQRQLFKLNNTWSPTYQTSRSYNLAGSVTSQTYPSGRTIAYGYDSAGRANSFTGNLGDGTQRNYATGITYNTWGTLAREQFGTSTAVYNKHHYNIRGQLCDVRASNVNDEWGGELGALVNYFSTAWAHCGSGTDNNGNVFMSQTIVNSYYMEDRYGYDSLNRLTSVSEYQNGATLTGTQQYTYDRWGNRTINPASTVGLNKQFTVDTATNRLGVPVGQSGTMTYDAAGNLITDTYSGFGNRTYDADNRMLTAGDMTGQTSRYSYNADGQRVRAQVASSQEKWYLYGFDGELMAEYSAMRPASSPEKEYGYRNGELLVTATGRFNVALAANGAVASGSSAHTCCGFSLTGAINGNNRGPWGNGEGWNDATENQLPDWIQVDFAGSKTIDEISVFSLHDNYTVENTPTETQTFTLYGLLAFEVQYWNGSSWVTVPGGSVTGNNKVWRKFTFTPITTSKIRVWISSVPDSWSRVVEIQAFGTSAGGEKIQWMVSDHLGTPRIIIDQTGLLANVKRHDYLPFGEELFAPTGGRSAALGYTTGDGVRQQFTSKERDFETGLDYMINRYYAPVQGRFTGVDPGNAQAMRDRSDPQSWNAYSYVNNNPLRRTDPDGKDIWERIRNALDGYGFKTDAQVQAEEDERRAEILASTQLTNCPGAVVFTDKNTGEITIYDVSALSREQVWNVSNDLRTGNYQIVYNQDFSNIPVIGAPTGPGKEPWRSTNASRPLNKMGHAQKHLKDFQKIDPNLTADDVAKILEHVRKIAKPTNTRGGAKAYEAAVDIGGKSVTVKVIESAGGIIKSGYPVQ